MESDNKTKNQSEEFYEKLDEWATVPPEEWNHMNIIAYFCYKYHKKHDIHFRLTKSKTGPISSKESKDFSKLFKELACDKYSELDQDEKRDERIRVNWAIFNYINWMFDYKFRSGVSSINSTAIFLNNGFLNEFDRMYKRHMQTKKVSNSFDDLMTWAKENTKEIFDRHQLMSADDLKMIKRYSDKYKLSDITDEKVLLAKASQMGLL